MRERRAAILDHHQDLIRAFEDGRGYPPSQEEQLALLREAERQYDESLDAAKKEGRE